jgi:hypothetical protein
MLLTSKVSIYFKELKKKQKKIKSLHDRLAGCAKDDEQLVIFKYTI